MNGSAHGLGDLMPPTCIMDGDIYHHMTRSDLQNRADQGAHAFSLMFISLRQSCLDEKTGFIYPRVLLILSTLSTEMDGAIDLGANFFPHRCIISPGYMLPDRQNSSQEVASLSTMILLEGLIDWL